MRLPRITVLLFAIAASPALAIDSAPDESAEDDTEDDSYIPNRFAITAHGEWAHFNQHRDVDDTGGGGLRIGFRANRWMEIEVGADVYQTDMSLESYNGTTTDLGRLRFYAFYAELRIDITNVDKIIPWPWPWCRPLIIGGAGFGVRDLTDEAEPALKLRGRRGGVIVRGGGAIEFGAPDSRVTFGVEWIYNWVGNDIHVSEVLDEYPSKVNLDYWTLGVYVVLRF
ncbi:MAG: hypothetical protein FD180_913 [Planctomycetota bacterium]|nr:MAG: hypothetical protein FD180_913 [Planctomycetota bacterium]